MDSRDAQEARVVGERALAIAESTEAATRAFGVAFDDVRLVTHEDFAEEPDLDQYSVLAVCPGEQLGQTLARVRDTWLTTAPEGTRTLMLEGSRLDALARTECVRALAEHADLRVVGVQQLGDGRAAIKIASTPHGVPLSELLLRVLQEALPASDDEAALLAHDAVSAEAHRARMRVSELERTTARLEERVKRLRERATKAQSSAKEANQRAQQAREEADAVTASWIGGAVRGYQRLLARARLLPSSRKARLAVGAGLATVALALGVGVPLLVGLATSAGLVGAMLLFTMELMAVVGAVALLLLRRLTGWARNGSEAACEVLKRHDRSAASLQRMEKAQKSAARRQAAKTDRALTELRRTRSAVLDVSAAVGPAGAPRFSEAAEELQTSLRNLERRQTEDAAEATKALAAIDSEHQARTDELHDALTMFQVRLQQLQREGLSQTTDQLLTAVSDASRRSEQSLTALDESVSAMRTLLTRSQSVLEDMSVAVGPASSQRLLEATRQVTDALSALQQAQREELARTADALATVVSDAEHRGQRMQGALTESVSAMRDQITESHNVLMNVSASVGPADSPRVTEAAHAVLEAISVQAQQIRADSSRLSDKASAEIQTQVRASENATIRQVQALLNLFHLVQPTADVPGMGGWAASPDLMLMLVAELTRSKPTTVVECGSGVSTLFMALAARRFGLSTRIVALEHEEEHAATTRKLLEEHGVAEFAEVRVAPLQPASTDLHDTPWYAESALEDLDDIGLLFVDGPPQTTGDQARYPAVPLLRERLGTPSVVILDDLIRPDEQEVARRWAELLPDFSFERLDLHKGAAVLRRG